MSDSNILKYDFRLQEHNNYRQSFVTPVLGESFYVNEQTFTKLQNLNQEKPEAFMEFQGNMERHIFDNSKRLCNEALFEK